MALAEGIGEHRLRRRRGQPSSRHFGPINRPSAGGATQLGIEMPGGRPNPNVVTSMANRDLKVEVVAHHPNRRRKHFLAADEMINKWQRKAYNTARPAHAHRNAPVARGVVRVGPPEPSAFKQRKDRRIRAVASARLVIATAAKPGSAEHADAA